MKYIVTLAATAAVLLFRPAGAAELEVLEPKDRTVVRGTVTLRIRPQNEPGEMFFENPLIEVQNESGKTLEKLEAPLDPATGICSVKWETGRFRDGLYTLALTYRTLVGGTTAKTDDEDVTVAVRNGKQKPAGFAVKVEDRPYKGEEACQLSVRVVDAKGDPFTGARVTFKVDKGEVDTDAELTDGSGQVFTVVDSEEVETVTLTITVEGLPSVTRVLRFVE